MISVVIPTYKTDLLKFKDVLNALFNQIGVQSENYEVIVVENITNECKDIVEDYGFRYLYVDKPNANFARNFGIENSKYNIIATIDDDIVVNERWISRLFGIHGLYSNIGVVGGPVNLNLPQEHKWIVDIFHNILGGLKLPLKSFTDIESNEEFHLISANLSFRKSVWRKIGGFPVWDIDYELRVNDENAFIKQCGNIGNPKICYDPELIVDHIISKERCTLEYLQQRFYNQGYCDGQEILLNKIKHRNLDNVYHNIVQYRANDFINLDHIQRARHIIAHEESTRIFIRYLIVCKTNYFKGMTDALENTNKAIWNNTKESVNWYVPTDQKKINKLALISCSFNPCGYKLPKENTKRFIECLGDYRQHLFFTELLLDNQKSEVDFENLFLLSGSLDKNLMWQKERLLNYTIDQVPQDYDAIAWIDSDIIFTNNDWYDRIIESLSKNKVCQGYERAYLLDKSGKIDHNHVSCGFMFKHNRPNALELTMSHPGFILSARSEILRKHKLYEYCITGGADSIMLLGFTNSAQLIVDRTAGEKAISHQREWQNKMLADVNNSFGYAENELFHLYHGDRQNRQYLFRWKMLKAFDFDPTTDIIIENNLLSWSDFAVNTKPKLIQYVRDYFLGRKEDE